VYAPNPDEPEETSAAKEFANRARGILWDACCLQPNDPKTAVHLIHLQDWDVSSLLQHDQNSDGTTTRPLDMLLLFLLSCGQDGAVHRSVRKLTNALKESSERVTSDNVIIAVGLLGHSICKTSAEQMADHVFAAGRRLVKALLLRHGNNKLVTFETQVELLPPEEEFDEWICSLWNLDAARERV
jgi:hypothetical protein